MSSLPPFERLRALPRVTLVGPPTPVERLEMHLTAMGGRVKALQAIKPALAALYTALAPDQKKRADELLTSMGCMM